MTPPHWELCASIDGDTGGIGRQTESPRGKGVQLQTKHGELRTFARDVVSIRSPCARILMRAVTTAGAKSYVKVIIRALMWQ